MSPSFKRMPAAKSLSVRRSDRRGGGSALRCRTARGEQGFTLLELLVVVVIIGIIAAIALPVLAAQGDRAKGARALAELRSMKTVVDLHYAEKNELPSADNSGAVGTIERAMNDAGIPWGDLSDPWEGFYTYRVDAHKYIVFTTRDNITYYYVTDRHPPTIGSFPEGCPVSGGVPSRDAAGEQPPSVATREATEVTAASSTLNMAYDFKGYQSGQVQFAYKRSGDAD